MVLHFVEVDRKEGKFLIAIKDKGGYFGQSSKWKAWNTSFVVEKSMRSGIDN